EPVDATEPVDAEEPVDADEPMAAAEPAAVVEPAEGRGRKTARPAAAERPAVTSLTEPLKAVAGDAMKSTWPPAAESAPAPPQETDIWPPEPPTERAMSAWPPPSALEEPSTPGQVIPSWPDSFAPATQGRTLRPPPARPQWLARTQEPRRPRHPEGRPVSVAAQPFTQARLGPRAIPPRPPPPAPLPPCPPAVSSSPCRKFPPGGCHPPSRPSLAPRS